MAMLQTVLTDGDGDGPRWQAWLKEMWTAARQHPRPLRLQALVRAHRHRAGHAEPRQLDHDLRQEGPFGAWRMTSRQGHGAPNPTWIPVANEAVRRIAAKLGGTAGGNIGEPFGMPLTAHFIGGCAIGDSPETGVIDAYQRVFGHPGLHVADGSAVTANLGRQPVAHDHRPGRARDGAVAQQGRGRPAPGARRAVRAGRSRSPPGRPSCPTPRPARCGSRSSASAEPRRFRRSRTGPGIGGPDRAKSRRKWPFYRRNPPPDALVGRTDPVFMLPPSDRAPSPGAVQQVRGRLRARPPSLPGRALVHFLVFVLPTASRGCGCVRPAALAVRADRRRRVAGGCFQRGCVALACATPRFSVAEAGPAVPRRCVGCHACLAVGGVRRAARASDQGGSVAGLLGAVLAGEALLGVGGLVEESPLGRW